MEHADDDLGLLHPIDEQVGPQRQKVKLNGIAAEVAPPLIVEAAARLLVAGDCIDH